jgi:predicted Zn finger-like uncharacterized protein
MKVACQQCGTAYSVADEKVAGRRVKLRCKNCSEPMIIDGTAVRADASADTPDAVTQLAPDQVTPVFLDAPFASHAPSAPAYSPAPTAEVGAAWHVAVGEGSQGPYTLDELARYVADGRIANDTLVYCDSFADWTPAGAVEELMLAASALRRPRPSAPPPPPPQLVPSPYERAVGMGRDPFEEREPAAAPASPRLTGEDLFNSRHEGTVQFSLEDMRAISAVSAASLMPSLPTSPSSYTSPGYSAPGYASGEGSGLIDVASLAAAEPGPYRTITDTHVSPLESHVTPMAVPLTLGQPAHGLDMRTKVFAGLSAFGFVLVAGVAVLAISRKPAAPQPVSVVATAQPPAPVAEAALVAAPAVPGAAPVAAEVAKAEPEAAPAAEPEPSAPAHEHREIAAVERTSKPSGTHASRDHGKHAAAVSDDIIDRPSKGAHHGKEAAPSKELASDAEPKPAKAGAKAANSSPDIDDLLAGTPTKKAAPKGGSSSIDDLLDGAVSAKKQPPKSEPAEPKETKSDLPMTPSRDDMLAAFGKAKGKAAKCKGDGIATAEITLAGSGKVTNVAVSGVDGAAKSCVENAVRSTGFPRFQKESFQVKFPFKLGG